MTKVFFPPETSSARPLPGDLASHVIWLLAAPEEVSTLGANIEPYGYSVLRLDPFDGAPAQAELPEPEMVLVDAHPEGPSIAARVGDAAALSGRPGVLVIDHGLDEIDRILALEAGADDCVSWPCPPREFIARMRAISRRLRPPAEPASATAPDTEHSDVLRFAGWALDRRQRRLSGPNHIAESLSAAEFAVLDHLLHQPRKTISREALLEATASIGGEETRTVRTVDIQISRLRKRLALDGEEIIRTVRGSGYMMVSAVTPD